MPRDYQLSAYPTPGTPSRAARNVLRMAAPYITPRNIRTAYRGVRGAAQTARKLFTRAPSKKAYKSVKSRYTVRKGQVGGSTFRSKGKKVKVSKNLRAKIKKVCEEEDVTAFYTNSQTAFLAAGIADSQIGWADQFWGNSAGLWPVKLQMFTPQMVNDAASVMFNGKGKTTSFTDTTGNFDDNVKLCVVYSSAKMHLENHTQTTKEICFFQCQAKNNEVNATTPLADFQSALDEDVADGLKIGQAGLLDALQNYGHSGLMSHLKGFKRNWNVKTQKVILAPGQTKDIYFQGPKNRCYDFQKFKDPNSVPTNVVRGVGYHMFYSTRSLTLLQGNGPVAGVRTPIHPSQTLINDNAAGSITVQFTWKLKVTAPSITPEAQLIPDKYSIDFTGMQASINADTHKVDVIEPVILANIPLAHGTGSGTIG